MGSVTRSWRAGAGRMKRIWIKGDKSMTRRWRIGVWRMTRTWKKIIRNGKELEDRSKEDVMELEKGSGCTITRTRIYGFTRIQSLAWSLQGF